MLNTILPPCEDELLLRLQTLFPAEQTREYQILCQKSDDGTLKELGRARLLALIEQRDNQNAERLQIVAELARLRGVSLREMIATLNVDVC